MIADDGRVVHSASFEANGFGAYISRPLTDDKKAQIAADIPLALRAGTLERVMRLHAQSLNRATDNYRAFVAAWSALEILVEKLFPIYQHVLQDKLRAVNESPALQSYLDRVTAIMGDKHNLTDKFAVLAIYLDDAQAADEVRIFRELKGVRNRLSHGEELDEATLPTKEVQRLFDKYLRNHLRRDA